jgi:subtilisin family serine protease
MAAPRVAGAAALLFEQHPELTAVQVKELLLQSAELDEDLIGRVKSGSKLDIDAALALANERYGAPAQA